ncbi:MAG: pyridoxamine 5'-phosphate oxidase family protein [Solobacterium sp.]|nr:pyridoxamine 5'-phosphate oxidase family protein [Solobacterium sp.]
MFRELVRKHKQLGTDDAIHVLKTETRGVLSVNGDDGYPYGMPMNHYYNEDDGCIYFHQGKVGYRLEMLQKDHKVSFCTFDKGYRNEGEWSLNVRSVVVFGTIEIIDDPEVIADIGEKLSRKFTQDEEYIRQEILRSGPGTYILKLTPEYMTGKLVNES